MDITPVEGSGEALFADIMATGEESQNLRGKAEKRERKGQSISKPRPVSMTTFPAGSAYTKPASASINPDGSTDQTSRRGYGLFGRGFPFSKPKAFFNSEQHLSGRVENYNSNRDILYQLKPLATSLDDIYSGVLKFHYSNGLEFVSDHLPVHTTSTVTELLPELITRFLPHQYQLDAVDGNQPSSITLVQGQKERMLEPSEKPLEIALDCSAKGLASPKFFFKSSLPPSAPPLTPRRISSHTSNVGGGGGGGGVVDEYSLEWSQPDHYNSLSSIGSGLSMGSGKSAKSKSNSSLAGKQSKKKPLHQSLSNELDLPVGVSPGSSPSHSSPRGHPHTTQNTPTPSSGRKISLSNSKAAVSNFITRSLRGRKKSRQQQQATDSPSNSQSQLQDISGRKEEEEIEEEEEGEDDDDDGESRLCSSLVFPRIPVSRKFTLSTVMHIYFTEGKQAQVYKSVLVSERASTGEVIAQALERYNMKGKEPREYALYDVIGKWQDVTENHQFGRHKVRNGPTSTLPNMNILNASPLISRRTAVEEFVVCYCRELGQHESPYNMQFYLTTQEGFTRRFELRSRSGPDPMIRAVSHEKSHSVDIMERAEELTPTPGDVGVAEDKASSDRQRDLGIFGNTVHRKRARRIRVGNHSMDSADPDTEVTCLRHSLPKTLREPSGAAKTKEVESGVLRGRRLGSGEVGVVMEEEGVVQVRENGMANASSMEIPISMTTGHVPDFSALMCSSPDSGVEFHKHSHHQPNSTKSSVSSEQSEQSATSDNRIALYPANLNCAFLLSLRLHNPGSEHLVYRLTADSTELGNWSFPHEQAPSMGSSATTVERISLASTPEDFTQQDGTLCCFSRQPIADSPPAQDGPQFRHILRRVNTSLQITVNGEDVLQPVDLHHGDIITLGNAYFFMFSDYTSTAMPQYNWGLAQKTARTTASVETIVERDLSRTAAGAVGEVENKGVLPQEVSSRGGHHGSKSTATKRGGRQNAESKKPHSGRDKNASSAASGPGTRPPHRKTEKVKSYATSKARSLPLPKDRKLVFSFQASEEDLLLNHVITSCVPGNCPCKLAPAYILAMCTEYCVMAGGPKPVLRFIQKATDRIQEVVWEFTKKLTSWELPESEGPKKPFHLRKELFPLLEPVFFWLANALEYYNFLVTHSNSLHLPPPTSPDHTSQAGGEGEEEVEEESALSTLYSILVYAYQQTFYSVSKVLYQSLPLMLETCVEQNLPEGRGSRPLVIGEGVEFLQALLDLITEQHLHLEVVSQFYANIFFFINVAMFNALLEQGGDLGLYQDSSGSVLRENLNLLEGWACQVGFKDAVLHFLAKFSGAIDLLATPTEKLLQLNWSDLCEEFPVLHPAQLHYMLSQYLLPSATEVPKHWTPTKEDAVHALTGGSLEESFSDHPGFQLPLSNFSLDLNRTPLETDHFQDTLDKLRSHLYHHNNEALPTSSSLNKNADLVTQNSVPTQQGGRVDGVDAGNVLNGHSGRSAGGRGKGHTGSNISSSNNRHLNSENSLFESARRNHKNADKAKYHGNDSHSIMASFQYQNGTADAPIGEQVGCVRTTVDPHSFTTPEKLILEPGIRVHPAAVATSSWMDKFPRGARTVTIPRGDKGFGFIMVEKKDSANKESLIVVQQILPGTTASHCQQLHPGDHILAIDEQLLDGADYLIADKYVKEAEDDVTLTLAPRLSEL